MVEALATFVTSRRLLSLSLVGLLLALSVATIVVRGVPFDFTPQALFTTFEEQQDVDARFRERFGNTENVALVIVQAPNVTDRHVLSAIHQLSSDIATAPYAERVESITRSAIPRSGGPGELLVDSPVDGDDVDEAEAEALRDALTQSALFDGTLVSESRQLAVIAVFFKPEYSALSLLEPAIRDIAQRLDARGPPEGATWEIGGLPNLRVYMIQRFRSDQARLIPLAMVVCAFILVLCFRWAPGVIAPCVAVALTAVVLVGAMAAAQEPFNIINQVVPTLLIVIGMSDAIHLVARYGEELTHTNERRDAGRRTVVAMATACLFTSFTTAIGFGSLAVSETEILARFGVTAAVGVLIAYWMTIVFLPAALTGSRPPKRMRAHGSGRIERITVACGAFAWKRPRLVLLIAGAVTAAFIGLGATVKIDTTLLEGFPNSDPMAVQTRMLERELQGVLPMEISLSSEAGDRFNDPDVLNATLAVQRWLEDESQVLATRSYPDLLREAWAAYMGDASRRTAEFTSREQIAQLASLLEGGRPNPVAPFVTPDRRNLRVSVQLRDDGSVATLALADRMRSEIDRQFAEVEGVTVELTGDGYSGSLGLDSLIRDLTNSLGLALVIIVVFMTLVFRSVRIGLVSIPANAIPLIGTLAYMGAMGIQLNTTTAIVFSISLGLAVDDSIHMFARFREERSAGRDVESAMMATLAGAGRAIVVTSVMLGCGMSVMLFSSFMPVRLFGELLCVTIVNCLIADLFVLPATMRLFGPR